MTKTLKEFVDQHPVDRARVEAHKERMLAEVRAHRLRELREQAGLTQAQLAERIGVGQRQVSKIENGALPAPRSAPSAATSKPSAASSPSSTSWEMNESRSPEPEPRRGET